MNGYSKFRTLVSWIKGFIFAGGGTWLVTEIQQAQLTGAMSIDAQDGEVLARVAQLSESNIQALALFVGVLFGTYKSLRNYTRNHPDAPEWMKALFGDQTVAQVSSIGDMLIEILTGLRKRVPVILLCAVLASTGCAHSGIRLNETMADGSSSSLAITTSSTIGKQDTLQNFAYQGEGKDPWRLTAGQDVQQDTTQALGLLKELLNVAAQIAPLYAPTAQAPVEAQDGNLRD